MKKIYLDHAASTSPAPEAAATAASFGQEHYANASALYSLASVPRRALKQARERIASLTGALTEEILFTSGGSGLGDSANNLQALAPGAKVVNGKRFSAGAAGKELAAWAKAWL